MSRTRCARLSLTTASPGEQKRANIDRDSSNHRRVHAVWNSIATPCSETPTYGCRGRSKQAHLTSHVIVSPPRLPSTRFPTLLWGVRHAGAHGTPVRWLDETPPATPVSTQLGIVSQAAQLYRRLFSSPRYICSQRSM
jgi:hypothetical protein